MHEETQIETPEIRLARATRDADDALRNACNLTAAVAREAWQAAWLAKSAASAALYVARVLATDGMHETPAWHAAAAARAEAAEAADVAAWKAYHAAAAAEKAAAAAYSAAK